MDPLQKKKLNGLLLGSSCLVASAFIGALPALANPTGPHVVAGHDTVSTSGKTTTVDQTSQKGFIDWNSFSIGKGQTVQFVQPGKGSVTVNRVTGGDPSKILGDLLATGGVWIINGNGILFGKGSIVNVGSLIATTSDLSDDDFKNGKYRFKKGSNPNASVINQGTITASKGGSVVLSAAHVANEGVIQANLGKVVLGGAAAFTVDLNGDNLIRYQITKPVSQTPVNSKGDARSALVSNSGTIEANGGEVLMTSRAASNVQDNVINNSGIVEATSVSSHDGEVDLDAGGGTVKDSGTVDVSGTQAGQTGGDVTITGRKIVVADGAHIDAQGANGGGTVLIGGGMHGGGKLEQAHKVIIGKAVIDVDATRKGNGGKVGIWSKGDTLLDGRISARGGRKGGDGGYVETSGRELGMDASALVDTSAAKGIGGTWLLDPTDVVIDNCGANCSVGNIDATAIGNSLSAGTNITVEAVGTGAGTGNISVDASVTANGAGTLSLLATFDIDVEESIQNAGSGGINLVAGWDGTTGISGSATTGESGSSVNIGAITSTPGAYGNNGGSVTIGNSYSSASISVGSAGGTTTVAAGGLTVGVGGNVTANAQLGYAGTSGGGDINVVLSGDLTIQSDDGGISRIGNTGTSGAVTGNITIAADNLTMHAYSGNYGLAVIGNAGNGTVSGNIAITTSGDVSMDAGTEFGKYDNTVTIGNETTSAAGASGKIKVAVGGGLSMYANYGGTARIGSDSATTNINVTVAGGITMQAGYSCDECGGVIHQGSDGSTYGSIVQIGNFGNGTSTVGGNISVTSTGGNITLTAQSGYVDIGNSGGLHVSGDVSVVAANGAIALNSYYGYSQIGNAGGGSAGTVTGNITVFAETGLSLYASYSVSHSQIGNYGYTGSGATVSGDIFISAFGGTTINGKGGTTVWIGNTGATETGNVTIVTGSLTVENGGDADNQTFGNMVASDLTGANVTATAGTGGSGGGNVTIAIESNVTTDWGTLFGNGLDFANGNTLSLITTGAQTVSTSITAVENGNVNLIAGWDGTTGYGPRSIIISDILSTPSAYGRTGGDITIGGTGDVAVGTAFGNTTVAGANVGVSSLGAAQAVIGFDGASSGNITVDATGNLTVSTPNGGTAQIGNGGANEAGDAGGNITINAGGEVVLDAAEGNVQIGNGGANANGDFSGNIDIVADGAIVLEGGGTEGDAGYTQIGNGGSGSSDGTGAGSDSGNITVQGASISLEAGSGFGSYVQIGHGGAGSDQASGAGTTGNIKVTATDGDILLQGGSTGDTGEEDNDYAQIGMGGPFSGTDTSNKDTGNITVHASGNISILGGTDDDQQNGFAIIGDSGTAEKTGNITVSAGGNITITGGSATGDPDFQGLSNSFALIGDNNGGSITGNVKVTAGGDLTLSGGGTGNTGDMAQIGDVSFDSDVTGNLSVNVNGTLSFTSTGDPALIADLASGTASGTTLIKTADIDLTSDFYGDLGQSLGDDLDNGNTTLEITDSTADTVIAGAINASSANTLKILDTGSLHIQSGIQNSGSGAIYVVAGWDGTTTSAGSLTNAGVFGNNAGSITVGDVLGNVTVGSRSGTTTFAAANVTVDAVGGYAQIGYHGAGGGNIVIDATNAVTVESGSNDDVSYDAVIGNGNFDDNTADTVGSATGNITVKAGTGGITVSAMGGNDIAAIGNVTDDGASGERGNITLNTTGAVMLETPDADSVAYIGDFSLASTTGGASGNITIDAGSLDITNAADSSESVIGNGGANGTGTATKFTNQGTVSGDITITAGDIDITATGAGQYGGQSRIANRGNGTVSGNISVNASGNMTLSTDLGDVASIGNSASGMNGISSGNITVVVGGNLSLLAQNSGESRIAAGQTADTNVNVTVTGDILMQVTGNPTTYGGQAIIGNFANGNTAASGNITVTSVSGNITLDAAEEDSFALIGNAIGTTVGGAVRVNAANGTIAVDAAGDGSLAQIGEFGQDGASGGDVFVTARNLELDASGAADASGGVAVAQIGNGSEDMADDASGNIAIAVSKNLTLEGGNGIAMIGNGDPFVLANNSTGTGNATGNITVAVGGTTTIGDSGTAPSVWIGNLADTGTESGSVTFKTKDIDDSGDVPGDFDAFVAADLDGGNVTLEFTDKTATAAFGGIGDYDSANTLKILSEGSIDITGSLQNAGSGAIYVIGGWDGATASASKLTNAGVYGNNHGSVMIGGAADQASVGSASGATTVAGYNVTVDAAQGLAQIGWDGAGGGNIAVLATGNVTVEAGTDFTAMIGNGGAGVTGAITGNIAITTAGGALALSAPDGGAIAEVGDLSDGASSEDSNITIDTNGGAISLASGGSSSFAQIGNWEDASNDSELTGNITINAGAITLNANGTDSSSQIGNGNYLAFANNGTIGGNIDIHATTLTVEETAPQGGFEEARIGNLGDGVVTGNVDVTTTGNILISADGAGAASIGNFSNPHDSNFNDLQGEGSGTVDVVSGGNITLSSNGTGAFTSIEFGGATNGSINVTARDDIMESASGGGASLIGAGLYFNGGVNINVTSKTGDIILQTTDTGSTAQIGNNEFNASGAIAGNITLKATQGDIEFLADGSQPNAIVIGNEGGAGATAAGNITVTAGNEIDIEDGADTILGNTGASETGDVTITAVSLVGDISPSIGNDLPGGDFTLTLTGDDTLTLATAEDYSGNHTLSITNAGDIVFDASLQNNGSGTLDVTSTDGNILIGGANATGNVAVGSGGTNVFSADNVTLDAVNGYAQIGYHGNRGGNISIEASGAVTLAGSSSRIAQIGDGANLDTSDAGGNVSIAAASLKASGKADIAGHSADIALSGHNNVGSASHPLDFAVNDLAIQTNGGNVFATSSTQGVSLGVGSDGIDLNGGDFSLAANGSVTQTQAILAVAIDIAGSTITLLNAGNAFGDVTLDASGNASLFDKRALVIASASSGGTLSLSSGGNISQTGAITAVVLNAKASHGAIALTNAGNNFVNATLNASGNASLFDAADLTIASADVGGALTLSSGGNIGQSGAITADALDATASHGVIVLTDTGNNFASASLTSLGNASLYDASDLVLTGADIGNTLSLTSGGDISQTGAITAKSLNVTADAITLTNAGNSFGDATLNASGNASLFDASDLTISGADVGGMLTLSSDGNIGQSGAIMADALDATASQGSIALTDSSNAIAAASLTASGNAALSDSSRLTITGANTGGALTLVDAHSISQTGAIAAKSLDVTANAITLTDSANAIGKAKLSASGNAALSDSSNLKLTGADVGGTLTLTDAGSITQTGNISAKALDAKAKHITLTNADNNFSNAEIDATDDASLFDASSVVISGADVGGTFTLASGGDIGQSGAITAGTLDATANQGSIALTNAGNAIGDASLTSSGDAAIYDSSSLTLQSAAIGGNLTLLTEGSLTFDSSVQLNNGNIFAVAGWDGTTTGASALTDAGAYGNNGGSIVVGGTGASGDVAVGSAKGSTTLAGADVSLEADNGYAQVGYHGSASGALEVLATQAVTLSGGAGTGDYAQIGNGGMDTSGNESGNITVKAGGAVTLDGGDGADAYAQIGHGGADADKDSSGYTNTGTITVQGQSIALIAGAGDQSYTQIGQGGFDLGDGLTGKGENEGDVDVTAADGVTLTGNGADAYAQIGNGGDHVNANAASSATGSNTGSVTVDGGSGAVTMTAGVDDSSYVQIGNGGFDVNAGDNPSNFSDSGTIMVSDLTLLGSNSGMDGYAQVGNGDASDNGVGDASGNITVSAGKIVLTDGRAKDSPALIGNQTGAGSISGTITGYTPPPTGDTNPTAPVIGAIETTIQSQTGEPVDVIITPPDDLPPPYGDSGAPPQLTGPLAQLTGDDGQVPDGVDIATDELGQSLDGNKDVQSVSIIPGVLTEVVYSETPHGIPPANQDFSSWGNEALWRW